MTKLRYVAKLIKIIIKGILTFLIPVLKSVLALLPGLLQELIENINKRLRFSITLKTTLTYSLIFSIILITLGILLTGGFGFFLIYESNNSLMKNNLVISDMISTSAELPGDQIKNYAAIEVIDVTLFDPKNHPTYSTAANRSSRTWGPQIRITSNITLDQNFQYLHWVNPVSLNHGISKIEITKNLANEKIYLFILIMATGISFMLAILLTIIIGARTSRKMLKPIDNMTRTARFISAGDLHTRLDVVDSHDELKDLAETFNEMLDRIQTSFEQQNVFVADASHELRTPIAVIQGYANLLQRWGTEDKAVLLESIDAIVSEAHYMQDLVEKLLFLASADKKNHKLETTQVGLHELIDEVVKETIMIDSHHLIKSELNETIMVNGDRGLIKQALRVFIHNSLKFTPAGGAITINSSLRAPKAVIVIADTGAGISADDLPYIFNRFYKSDKSRNRESGGAGLGLSIAKWIIEQHQGEIKVESNPGQGTKIIISLPALAKPI